MKQDSQSGEWSISRQVNQLIMGIENVDRNISNERIPEKVILLMGETKAGKTTLLYYLLKKKLVLERNDLGIAQMKAEALCFNARIGNNYSSTTVYPNIPTDIDEGTQQCLIIDMPGFNDTRSQYRLLNIYIIHEVIKHIKTVHISVVLPYQCISGEQLVQALLNTCVLLNADLFKAKHCLSFMLTKVEDEEQDMESFKEEMQNLAEQYQEQPISSVVKDFQQRNIYVFCSKEPDVEAGGELKKKLLHENQFYSIDQTPSKLLSSDYANIIIGRGNIDQFNSYVVEIVNQLARQFGELIKMFRLMVIYQHYQLVGAVYAKDMGLSNIQENIESMKGQLNMGNLSENLPSYSQTNFSDRKENILSFVSKMRRNNTENGQQKQVIQNKLSDFVRYSEILVKQESGIPRELRRMVHVYLKNGLILINTISQLSDLDDVEPTIDRFFKSKQIGQACQQYYEMIRNQQLLNTILIEAEQFNQSQKEFQQTLIYYHPQLEFKKEYQTKVVHQPSMDNIQRRQWKSQFTKVQKTLRSQQALNQTMEVSVIPSSVEEIDEKIELIQKLGSSSLKVLLESVREVLLKKQVQYLVYKHHLWSKTIHVLQQLHLLQLAIMFALSMPDEIEAEYLIDLGLKFNQISVEFIEGILVPYYSQISLNFQMVEKLFNFISLKALEFKDVIVVETNYISVLKQMRNTLKQSNGQFQYNLRRFNEEFLGFVSEGGKAVNDILKLAKQRNVKLNSCSLVNEVIHKQLQSLEQICL